MTTRVLLVALVAALLAPAAKASRHATSATTVTVTMTEFRFALTKKVAPKGVVVFKLVNKGTVSHDFKINGKRSPTIEPGARRAFRVTFKKAGKYPYVCTLPGHAAAGMKGVLTLK